MSRRRIHALFAASGIAWMAFSCGSDREVHPWSAWTYDPDRDCLENPTVIDVLNGPVGNSCTQLRCWVSPANITYITDTACDGPPDYKNETKSTTGLCAEAISVFGRDQMGACPDQDGGVGGGS